VSTVGPPRKPAWRSVVDGLDRVVTPQANAFVRTSLFANMLAASTRLEVQLRRRVERQSTWLWHFWNLPTASDIRRVRAQLSALEGRMRDISERLEDAALEASERSRNGGEHASGGDRASDGGAQAGDGGESDRDDERGSDAGGGQQLHSEG
jgi:hypothetical protein